jgi:ankyrin repeat protein
VPERLTSEEAKGLLHLCRTGRLYEIEKWIASGLSIHTPPEIRRTPLHIAIDSGFHSLVELLARHESRQEAKNQALSHAVSEKRLDFVELLVAHGAQASSIPLADVLLNWEPAMIRFFLENGADVVAGAPFAVAFREKIRTALRPFVEYKRTHPELATQLQEQADRALRHFCYEGDLKWVSLLLWAGANPRTCGPTLDDRSADDSECYTTALREACVKGNLEILKRLKPDPQIDNVSELLSSAAIATSKDLIDYLLALGATPNDKENGGSSALDHCFWDLGFANIHAFINKQPLTRYDVSKVFECIHLLVAHGALWRPTARTGLNSLRQTLYKCEPVVTVDLVP